MITPQLLTSALIYIRDHKYNLIKCRALLDTCATANLVSEAVIKHLGINVVANSSPIGTVNAMSIESKGLVQITIQSICDGFHKNLTCLVIPTITDLIPSDTFPRNSIKIPANIRLADPEFHLPRPVDVLIGSETTLSLFSIGQINLSHGGNDLFSQKTRLGWVVAGGTAQKPSLKSSACYLTSLENQIAKFWEIEEVAVEKPKSEEDIECETHFIKNTDRDCNGRYIIRLPFRKTNNYLGESRRVALNRLVSLERKLDANTTLKDEYTRIIEEYVNLGHMSVLENPGDDDYYMPHHAVIKKSSNTTKVRVVFDASAKTSSGTSLNDMLMTGPTIQDNLFTHLIRFRLYNYVITADIEKMYRQVLVHEDDRRYQRVLWRKHNAIQTLQINTLTFGVSSAPFLAIRTIQRLADDECHTYPRAAQIIKKHLYVDDLLSGAKTIDEARTIRHEVIALLSKGGFAIRQWASNDKRVIDDLTPTELHANFILNLDRSLKTLGIYWNIREDEIRYSALPIAINERITKRNVLSEIAKIFDPMGLLGPVVMYAKKLMQDIWRSGVQWDESLPQNIYTEWSTFIQQIELLNQVSFDRKLLVEEHRNIQVHGFCDASNTDYGACLYIRTSENQGKVISRMLCAKSRVAPLKPITIPRLELCGALLLARLYREASSALEIASDKTIFWCDSTITLHWIKTSPHLLKTYVANRVAEIQELTRSIEWRHIKSEDNPADAISRRQLPHAFLQNRIWRTGPPWLIKDEGEWPKERMRVIKTPELKRNICLTTTLDSLGIAERYSSYSKLRRIIAYCLRFRPANKHNGPLNAGEIDTAETRILKVIQTTQFSDEIRELKLRNAINKGRIANLSPFLDENGVIRVGGRLRMSNLTYAQKHPILLPNRHRLTDSIIREIHEAYHHTGIQSTLYILRQKFWLLDGRNQVRKVVRTCSRCFRFNNNTVEYKMGNLPRVRISEAIPFANTGVDYCGPFYIKEKKHRNRTRIKVYVCVFVCMSIKAVHLEVVSDLSSHGFIAALRRFISRRGIPEHIYSDNGTNFVGANNQLKEMYVLFNSEEHQNILSRFASEHHIIWHFIPPVAPHFGGLWEATVKLFKHHFKRVVGDTLFTFVELNTFVTEVEGILNSRPITSISSDPNDLLALTPAHYLIGKPLTFLPEDNLSSVPANRLNTWQHIIKMRQDFWARWHLEYLNKLQKRSTWLKNHAPELSVGTVVLIKDKNLPCTQWSLGRVATLHPGEDGIVRTATLKTSSGEIKRAAKQLCPLPIDK